MYQFLTTSLCYFVCITCFEYDGHYDIYYENFAKLPQNILNNAKPRRGEIAFDRYLRHHEINAYLDKIANDYPDIVALTSIGQSYEGRDMKLVRISSAQDKARPNPVIFVDGGFHGNEFPSISTAVYLIQQLVENSSNRYLIKNVDWVILPSVNPDAYEYSMVEGIPWRKTRSINGACDGVDPNRNFGYKWVGSDRCDVTYPGKEPFSEAETRNLRDHLLNLKNVKAYMSLHTCGKFLLYPWGYAEIPADNENELKRVGNMMKDAIASVRNTVYKVGNAAIALYPANGASDDWAKSIGIDIVFTIELPCGSEGQVVSDEEIFPVAQETFEGFKILHKYINETYN